MNNFLQRTVTGLIYVAVITASLLLHPFAFTIVFTVITVIALAEFYKLTSLQQLNALKYPGMISGAWLFLINFLYASGHIQISFLIILILLISLLFFYGLFRQKDNFILTTGITYLGIIYIALPLSMLIYLCFPDRNSSSWTYEILLGYLIILWIFDAGAYILGSLLGRHKIMEKVSPAKSWEGLIGGLLVASGAAVLIAQVFKRLSLADWIILSIITGITGTLGDFVESAIKRSASVKDSGQILPGHGGMLDRIDSVLLSAPFVLIYLLIRNIL